MNVGRWKMPYDNLRRLLEVKKSLNGTGLEALSYNSRCFSKNWRALSHMDSERTCPVSGSAK